MSEYEAEVKKAEKELEQGLSPVSKDVDEFLGEVKMQTDHQGQKVQDLADKARIYAEEKLAWAGDKVKELQNKDPKEIVEDAKEYARQKPGQTILISAAIGLVIGMLLRRK
ncbi:MAG TPA: hypothetical protein VJ781_11435 [Pyrinomonadaceae bacterium]|jgi:ElaB/YqjD/DUF883 family membrane-anchored ribosome-binding protein|nr:hypothetical protein [Pyrinomonadaceae bacterium]